MLETQRKKTNRKANRKIENSLKDKHTITGTRFGGKIGNQGCQIFLGTTYQNGENMYTK
jgi:hypothetical protein